MQRTVPDAERRLEQVRGVHGAAGRGAGADHGVDLVDEQDRAGIGLKLLDDLLEPLLEIAAIARAGKQRAHVEREHGRIAQHVRHFAMDDAPRQPFGDRGLADAGFADEQRIVLLPPAQHLDGAADLGIAADQRIDLALARLLVEVDAIGVERVALFLRLVAVLGVGVFVGAAHRARFRHARPLGDAVADIVDRVVARHVLLLQEIGGVALALGEDRDQHVGAGHLLAARRLDVDHRALDDALEAGGGLGILGAVGDQIVEFRFEIGDETAAQLVQIDIARPHDRRRVLILDQREQQVLERGVFVMALVGERQSPVERLFKAAREGGHFNVSSFVLAVPPESLLLHDALQRMLMFAGKVHDLRHFGLGHLVGENPAFADPVLVHMHHDPMRRLLVLVEEPLEHMDHELHRRVVVVEQQDAIEVRPLGLRPRLGDDRRPRPALVVLALAVVVRHADAADV